MSPMIAPRRTSRKSSPGPATGNPRDSWPAWTDARWTLAPESSSSIELSDFASQSEGETGPTAGPAFTPSPAAVAWNDAYAIGYGHDPDAVPPADMPEGLALSWWHGRNSGWLARDRADAERARMASPRALDPIEAVEAYGRWLAGPPGSTFKASPGRALCDATPGLMGGIGRDAGRCR